MKAFVALPVMFAASTFATVSMADISVDQAYDQIFKLMQFGPAGEPEVGQVVRTGDTLIANDIKMMFEDKELTVEASIPSITFTDQGDGSVMVKYADTMPIVMRENGIRGETVARMSLSQPNTTYVLSGTPEETKYDYNAPVTTFRIESVTTPDGDVDISGDIVLENGSGSYLNKMGEMMSIDMDFTMDNISTDISYNLGEGGDSGAIKGNMTDLQATGVVVIPADMSQMNPENPFADGMAVDVKYNFAGMDFAVDMKSRNDPGKISFQSGAVEFAMVMNADKMAYASTTSDFSVNGHIPSAFPLPISASASELGMTWEMPLGKNVRGDYELGLSMRDIAVDDALLNMFDPGQIMPRDPVTMAFNLSGQAMWYFDMFDPADAAAMERAAVPGEIYSATLSDLEVDALGARLTGAGDFTFDNSDFQTIPGMPRPQGNLSMKLVGANGLIDRLIQMGIISDQDAMGARMMMGMVATAEGEDTLTSTLDINEQGHVSANGMRLK